MSCTFIIVIERSRNRMNGCILYNSLVMVKCIICKTIVSMTPKITYCLRSYCIIPNAAILNGLANKMIQNGICICMHMFKIYKVV